MTRRNITCIATSHVILLLCKVAFASGPLDVQFEFDKSIFVVGPQDNIRLDVTLTNLPSSTTNLEGGQLDWLQIIGGTLCGQNGPYNMDFGPLGDGTNFQFLHDNIDLQPGQSLSFVFGYLVPLPPLNSPIPLGVYTSGPANMKFNGILYPTSNGLKVTVVPEPPSFVLFVLMLFGIVVFLKTSYQLR